MEDSLYTLHADIEETHWWFRGRRRIVSALIEAIVGKNSDDVFIIDIGCGTGANMAHLAEQYQGIGIDTSHHAIKAAKRKYPNVTFVEGNVDTALKELPQKADIVMLLDVIEHVEDDRSLVATALSALKPGGHLLLTVPADIRLWSEHDVLFGHYRRYDIDGLRAVWQGMDVEEKLCSYFNARLYYPVRIIRFLKRTLLRSKEAEGHDFGPTWGPLNGMLEGLFAGEQKRLLASMDQPSRKGYRHGVSLVAVLRRGEKM